MNTDVAITMTMECGACGKAHTASAGLSLAIPDGPCYDGYNAGADDARLAVGAAARKLFGELLYQRYLCENGPVQS